MRAEAERFWLGHRPSVFQIMVILVTCSEVHIRVGQVTGAVEIDKSTAFRTKLSWGEAFYLLSSGLELNCFLVLSVLCCRAFPNNSLSFQTAILLNTV